MSKQIFIVEEVVLNREKFTFVKKEVQTQEGLQTFQVSIGGHNHSEEKVTRLAAMIKG